MWFEVLPSYAILATLMGIPTLAYIGINKLMFKNTYQRCVRGNEYRHFYLRDQRLTGKGFICKKLSEADDI